jgi:hypothetical protein
MDKGAKKKLDSTIKSSLIYTKPNRKIKTKSNFYVIKKKCNTPSFCSVVICANDPLNTSLTTHEES